MTLSLPAPPESVPASRARLAVILGSLTALGPMSIDMYLPALPRLSERFAASESAVQLTLTACLAGLALGQLLAGPLSDSLGRRRPLVIGLSVYVLASLACALAPTAEILTAARLLQGLAGAAGVVIARAVARDLYSGPGLARFFSMLMLVNGLAPILAPVIGSQLLRVMPWQGIFVALAGYGLLVTIGARFGLPETLPLELRRQRLGQGGFRSSGAVFGELLGDRRFVGYALASGMVFAAMFAYIAGSPFVLQQVYGLSPQQFGLAFGLNALGLVALGQLNGLLLRWVRSTRLLLAGLLLAVSGAFGLLAAVHAGLGLPAVLAAMFAVVSSAGLVVPNATALALTELPPEKAGSGSALLGVLQFSFGAATAPLVGVAGSASAMPIAVMMSALTATGLLVFAVLTTSRRARPAPAEGPAPAEPPVPAGTGAPGAGH